MTLFTYPCIGYSGNDKALRYYSILMGKYSSCVKILKHTVKKKNLNRGHVLGYSNNVMSRNIYL